MKRALTASLSAVSICGLACLFPGVAGANGSDANALTNQAQLHPWEANQTGWTPYGVPVGEVYPAAPGALLGRTAIISLAMTRSYRPCPATTMATRLHPAPA